VILMRGTVEACRPSIEHHRRVIPDDAERDRQGERISTGIAASTVHQGGHADGEAAATGRASTGHASATVNPDAGVQLGVGSGVPPGTVTVSPGAARGGGWSRRHTGWPTGSGAPRMSRRGENGQ
jgi:hypothetical protein